MNQQYFKELLIKLISKELNVPAESIRTDYQFTQLGLDSIAAVTLSGDLEDTICQKLSATLLWDHPTINSLAHHLAQLVEADSSDSNVVEYPLFDVELNELISA